MSLLLVVVLLFFSSSCSVSSGQYYVSDDCSSVTQSPCNPLSVYAGNMSQYNNTIFYFIGTTYIRYYVVTMTAVMNVTLHGLDQSPSINCNGASKTSILVYYSNDATISNILFSDCSLEIHSSNNITIANSSFIRSKSGTLQLYNAFDVKISSSLYNGYKIDIQYDPLPVCSDELPHYSLILTNVNLTQLPDAGEMQLVINNGNSYNVSIIIDHLYSAQCFSLELFESIFNFFIIKSSFHNNTFSIGFYINFGEYSSPTKCSYPVITLASNVILIEESQLYKNWHGFQITTDKYLPGTVDYHIIIKSCLMHDNEAGLFIDATFLRFLQIDIINTQFIGNGGNKIMNSNAISLSNVTVANSTYTGLTLERSLVTIKDDLIFKNNTGVVGGGLAINDSSVLIVSSSANLEFTDNHASYKGGGIYLEESTYSNTKLMTPNIPLTLINNSAGLVGGDTYGMACYQFNLTNPHISSTGNPVSLCFCDLHAINITKSCFYVSKQHIHPGQTLQYYVALLGYDYFGSLTPTDGTVQ
uniref:Right handed beta helix domain-containing protein n=1 Tax=Amphimedon queenslandica TaxID=400682 RepID=A0A1X7TKA7_AMPQE